MNLKSYVGEDKGKLYASSIVGMLFASGLAISGMILGSKLFGFLDISSIASKEWDPTLLTVLASAVSVSMISYPFVNGFVFIEHEKKMTCPLFADKFSIPTTNGTIDNKLVLGAATFGAGWGLGLLCPAAPALIHASLGNTDVLYRWIPGAFVAGSCAAQQVKG